MNSLYTDFNSSWNSENKKACEHYTALLMVLKVISEEEGYRLLEMINSVDPESRNLVVSIFRSGTLLKKDKNE